MSSAEAPGLARVPATRGSWDYQRAELEFMSQEQLAETCARLSGRQQLMSALLGDLHNERVKLQRHRAMLRDRIARVEASGSAAGRAGAGGAAASDRPAGIAAAAAFPPIGRGGPAAPPWAVGASRADAGGADAAPTSSGERMPVASDLSDTTYGTTAGGASSSSSQPAVSCAQGPSIAAALSERLALSCELTPPEELLLRHSPDGIVTLTWFYNEQLLEQLENPNHPLRRLSFEIRQQSEGTNGRLRSRMHVCRCRTLSDSEEVCEQSFELEGCVPGRAYAFSARARAEFDGAASPLYSAFSDMVSLGAFSSAHGPGTDCAASTEGGFSTSGSTPRESAAVRREHSTERAHGADHALESVDEEMRAAAEVAWGRAAPEPARVRLQQAEEEARRSAEEAVRKEEQAKRREEEARQRLADTRRRLEQEAQRRRAEEEARRRSAEQEAARRTADDEEGLRRVEQEAARRCVEEEVRRRVAKEKRRIEEESRLRSEEVQRTAHEDAKRTLEADFKAREDTRVQQEEQEARRRAQELDLEQQRLRRQVEEEVARRVEGERQRLAAEAKCAEEAAQRRFEGEALQRRLEEEERARKLENENNRVLEEERRRHAEAARRTEAEAKRRIDEEVAQRRLAEAERQAAEEARAQASRQASEEARRREAESRQREEAARRLEEERRARLEEQQCRRRAEEEAAEAKRRAEQEAFKKRESEARRRESEEAQRMQEQARRAHEEAQRRMQAEVLEKRMEAERQRRLDDGGEQAGPAEGGQEKKMNMPSDEETLQRRVEEEIQARVEAMARKRAQEEEEARRLEEQERTRLEDTDTEEEAAEGPAEVTLDSQPRAEEGAAASGAAQRDKEEEAVRRMEEKVERRVRDLLKSLPGPAGGGGAAPFSSSFAQGFAHYCTDKGAGAGSAGASGAEAPASGGSRSLGPSKRSAPAGIAPSLASRALSSAPRGARSPSDAALPHSAARSPTGPGCRTPAESAAAAVAAAVREKARAGDPMDKWMNKILSERASSLDTSSQLDRSGKDGELVGLEVAAPRGRPGAARSPPPPEGRQLHPRAGAVLSAAALPPDGLGQTVMQLPKRVLPGGPTREPAVASRGPAAASRGRAEPSAAPSPLSTTPQHRPQQGAAGLSVERPAARIPEQTRQVNPRGLSPTRSVQAATQRQAQAQAQALAAAGAPRQAPAVAPSHGPGGLVPPPRTSSFGHAPAYLGVPAVQRSQSPTHPACHSQAQPPGPMQQRAPAVSQLPGHAPQQHGGPAVAALPMAQAQAPAGTLEGMVSQRMQRANELAQRLAACGGGVRGGGCSLGGFGLGNGAHPTGSQAALPVAPVVSAARPQAGPGGGLGTTEACGAQMSAAAAAATLRGGLAPPWAQEAPPQAQHGFLFSPPAARHPHAPPGSGIGDFRAAHPGGPGTPADSFADHSQFFDTSIGDPLGVGLQTLHNLPPPPRSAPAAEALPPGGGAARGAAGGGALLCDVPQPSRERAAAGGPAGPQFSLTVLTSDSRWELLNFAPGEDLDHKGAAFLRQKGLKAAFQAGLVSKMHGMIQLGQAQSSVDIVDLI